VSVLHPISQFKLCRGCYSSSELVAVLTINIHNG
jgi:hypothetical protein